MKFFYSKLRSFALVLTLLAITQITQAQEGRLPTQQELTTKAMLQQLYTSASYKASSPNHLMTTGPEQDCDNATPVCSSTYNQTTSYTGNGTIQEVNGTCLSTQETNSVWYVFTVQNSGTFTFLLNTANDYDYESVFSRQIEGLGETGDVLIAISTSGNSSNVLKAVETAKKQGLITIGFTGEKGGKLVSITDHCFKAASAKTPHIQEMHITALHAVSEVVEDSLFS